MRKKGVLESPAKNLISSSPFNFSLDGKYYLVYAVFTSITFLHSIHCFLLFVIVDYIIFLKLKQIFVWEVIIRKMKRLTSSDVGIKMDNFPTKVLNQLISDSQQLAEYLHCSTQAINQYKNGTSRPSLDNLSKIADYYNVTTDYLLGRTEASSSDPDIRTACDYTGLSPKTVDILHTLTNSPSYARDLRISFINHILESDIFWNRIVEHLQSAYQLRKGYKSELDPEQAEKLEESAAFIKALNFGGLTKYTISDGSFSSDMQIQFAADASRDLFRALIDDILKKEDKVETL